MPLSCPFTCLKISTSRPEALHRCAVGDKTDGGVCVRFAAEREVEQGEELLIDYSERAPRHVEAFKAFKVEERPTRGS